MLEANIERMRRALAIIAFERKGVKGGYISRRDLVNIARRTLIECGIDLPRREGDRVIY